MERSHELNVIRHVASSCRRRVMEGKRPLTAHNRASFSDVGTLLSSNWLTTVCHLASSASNVDMFSPSGRS